jgi:hypothetical protein
MPEQPGDLFRLFLHENLVGVSRKFGTHGHISTPQFAVHGVVEKSGHFGQRFGFPSHTLAHPCQTRFRQLPPFQLVSGASDRW